MIDFSWPTWEAESVMIVSISAIAVWTLGNVVLVDDGTYDGASRSVSGEKTGSVVAVTSVVVGGASAWSAECLVLDPREANAAVAPAITTTAATIATTTIRFERDGGVGARSGPIE